MAHWGHYRRLHGFEEWIFFFGGVRMGIFYSYRITTPVGRLVLHNGPEKLAVSAQATTSSSRSAAIAVVSKSSTSRRISLVCSPSSGGGVSYRSGRSDKPIGERRVFRSPAVGCGSVWTNPASSTSGLVNASVRLRTGPQGTPAARSFSTQ